MLSILLTGGAGYIGQLHFDELTDAGRTRSRTCPFVRAGSRPLNGDLGQPERVRGSLTLIESGQARQFPEPRW